MPVNSKRHSQPSSECVKPRDLHYHSMYAHKKATFIYENDRPSTNPSRPFGRPTLFTNIRIEFTVDVVVVRCPKCLRHGKLGNDPQHLQVGQRHPARLEVRRDLIRWLAVVRRVDFILEHLLQDDLGLHATCIARHTNRHIHALAR